ncbi:MAG TPA: sigma-54 dependent transcriptional regulator [Terriglobales bacterium]|nr:sigma-54 dependent transcriptional regulator [Terriglobales bacterium]
MDIDFIGSSPAMAGVLQALRKAARCDTSVLLLGETGTGKDLAARKIHELSPRRASPFVAINCSNLPDTLFESELFGHTRGAFTGAVHEKAGLLDAAQNGTVFMDEIGELALHLQAKILRLLDKRETRKIGETQTRIVKARFIFATNRDLYANAVAGSFRKDLYYRINILLIRIPPLRERREDIPHLVAHFVSRENCRSGTVKRMSSEASQKLLDHEFPGNVRELENVVARACLFAEDEVISPEDIRFDGEGSLPSGDWTRDSLQQTLRQCHWNKTKAALQLGKSRRQLYRMLKKFRLDGKHSE